MGKDAASADFERWVEAKGELSEEDQAYVDMVRKMIDLFDKADPSPSAMACLNHMKGKRV
jgi:hypothetical protein